MVLVLVCIAAYLACHIFPGQAAFLLMGHAGYVHERRQRFSGSSLASARWWLKAHCRGRA